MSHGLALLYVHNVRNKAKKAYARSYLAWLETGSVGDPPAHPDLSYMGAQAVRMTIERLHTAKVTFDSA